MKMSNVALALSGVVFGGVLLSSHASAAEGRLVVYCSAQNTMCEQETMAFEKKLMLRKTTLKGMCGMAVRLILILKRVKWAYLKRISHQISHKFLNSLEIPLKLKATIPPRFISVY